MSSFRLFESFLSPPEGPKHRFLANFNIILNFEAKIYPL